MGELYRYGEKVKLELPSVDVGDSDPNQSRFYGIFLYRAEDPTDKFKELCILHVSGYNYPIRKYIADYSISCYSILTWSKTIGPLFK